MVARLGRWSAARGPLYVLLSTRLRQLIDDGELPPGALLPPDRALAAALAVGRTTVVAAYDLLEQAGKIVRRQGSGTRVAPACLKPDPSRSAGNTNPLFLHLLEPPDHLIQLTCAAPRTMPDAVTKAYAGALAATPTDDLGYHPAGHPALRAVLAARYGRRGLPTAPDQILVTTGAQQALSLLAARLVRPGDKVIVEAPTYPGALEVFREAMAILRAVPLGADGLDPDALVRALRQERPAAAYLIPTYHNPTGSVLPTLSRRRIVEAAASHRIPLIDDEVLADLGFDDERPPPLAMFAPEQVITVGSLSKIIWGGIRVGWLRAPAALVTQLARLKAIHDLGSDVLAQHTATELVGQLDGLRRQRAAELHQRHDRLRAELRAQLPEWEFTPAAGGQTLWVRLPHGDGDSFAQLALRHGVAVLPGACLDITGHSQQYLRIPFLSAPETLADAVRRLTAAWREYRPTARASAVLTPLIV
ncbi:MAG: PLP-dependent aminotransferase family protein [Pseudonocardia sp.]|nr:PLP-dependent aminotransferase family protein [Pseudonocardia sp.]